MSVGCYKAEQITIIIKETNKRFIIGLLSVYYGVIKSGFSDYRFVS